MTFMRTTLAALTLLVSTVAATADPLDDAMRWVADNSRFEYRNDPPKIVPLTEEEWNTNGWQLNWAVYDKGFLYIPDWKEVPPSTWVHESVHHYQWLNGEMPPGSCPGLFEPEAYELEAKWLDEQGLTDDLPSLLWIIMMESACLMQNR